jgi:hypothetical protein
MKAQTFAAQALDQDPADAKPQRISASQHHRALIAPKGKQFLAQSDWIVTGDAALGCWAGRPLLQGRQQPVWGCQKVGLLHQELSSGWE